MRAKEMHPLCCITVDCPGGGIGCADRSPAPWEGRAPEANAVSEVFVAGVLYKWTNFCKGWRSRWFCLRGCVLSYSKVRIQVEAGAGEDVRFSGIPSPARMYRIEGGGRRRQRKHTGVVSLKISSFRESRSDDRRFCIFSNTKTLYLKADSRKDRRAWFDALASARGVFPLSSFSERISVLQNDASLPTEGLKNRLLEEGLDEALVMDCEQIVLSEFSQLKFRYEEHLNLLGFQRVQCVNADGGRLLIKNGFSSSGLGKYSKYSATESSDDVERQEFDEFSDEDEPCFFDSNDSFSESSAEYGSIMGVMNHVDMNGKIVTNPNNMAIMLSEIEAGQQGVSQIERRKKLPDPVEKELGVSLWSIIKENVGKDLTRVCLPVYFNEPLSSLQKCFEDLEYSDLLDKAYEYGKMGNSLMRILNVAAFAASGYASSEGRPCKPFNPLLGETYEADYPEKGVRFFSEKVSHHPMLIACHCEGRGWKFWGDSNLRSKFWGRSIQLDPVGVLTLEFDDGEIFQWSKVTTGIYNIILGKMYCDHHGTMHIKGNRLHSCILKFKEQSMFDRNPHHVEGFVEDNHGSKVANLIGKWNDNMYYVNDNILLREKGADTLQHASLLWKKNKPPANATRYNLSSFAITLNELSSELEEKLPPTDSRHRPDQRHLENGKYEKANAEKQRLEKRQRMSRRLQETGWKPRWFQRHSENGTYHYIGGYWEAREQRKWDRCPNIFGEIQDDTNTFH